MTEIVEKPCTPVSGRPSEHPLNRTESLFARRKHGGAGLSLRDRLRIVRLPVSILSRLACVPVPAASNFLAGRMAKCGAANRRQILRVLREIGLIAVPRRKPTRCVVCGSFYPTRPRPVMASEFQSDRRQRAACSFPLRIDHENIDMDDYIAIVPIVPRVDVGHRSASNGSQRQGALPLCGSTFHPQDSPFDIFGRDHRDRIVWMDSPSEFFHSHTHISETAQ